MCGIVGILSTTVLTKSQTDQFEKLLIMDQVRGLDSCGIIAEKATAPASFTKSIWDPATFLGDRRTRAVINGAKALVGHNRAATRGNVIASNAHPFNHGAVTLVHNGTLTFPMPEHSTKFDVDSESIAYNLSLIAPEAAGSFLETLNGAYALVWYDDRDQTWNIAKNEDRPLHIMTLVGGATMYISSEAGILYAAVSKDVTIADPEKMIVPVPVGEHWKISTNGSAKLVRSVSKFTPKKTYATVGFGRQVATTTHKDSQSSTTSKSGNIFVEDLKELLNLEPGWHKVDIDKRGASGSYQGYLCFEPYNEVQIHTAENIDYSKDYEVYISGLSKSHPTNVKARTAYDYVLFSSTVREKKSVPPVVIEGETKKESVDPLQCVNCGGVFLDGEMYHLNDGDTLCKACYDSDDNDSQLYAKTVGIKTKPVK